MKIIIILVLILPFRVMAWDDNAVLLFINQTNPILQAQHNVTVAYKKPDAVTWAMQNTSISGRLAYGGTDFINAPYTAYGGLQIPTGCFLIAR